MPNRANHASISRRTFLATAGFGFIGGALALAGCGAQATTSSSAAASGAAATSSASTGDLKTIRIGYAGDVANVKLEYSTGIAHDQGFLEEELKKAGYKPEYTGFPQAGPAINEAFAGGSIDVAQYSEMPAITVRSKGVDVKAFAVCDSRQAFAILASDKSGVQSVADLKGKQIAVAFGTVPQRYLLLELQKAGLTDKDVQLTNVAAQDAPTMVATAGVDACAGMFTIIHENEKKGGSHIIATSIDDPSLSTTSIFFGRAEFLKENRDAAVAIVRALKKAYDYAQKNPDDARKILASAGTPADAVNIEFADNSFPGFNPQITDEVRQKYQGVEQFLRDNQLIATDVSIDDLVDTSIYQDA